MTENEVYLEQSLLGRDPASPERGLTEQDTVAPLEMSLRGHACEPGLGYKYPEIPSDANFDPFSPVKPLNPDPDNPFNFLEDDQLNHHRDMPYGTGPFLMSDDDDDIEMTTDATITDVERAALERDIANWQSDDLNVADLTDFPQADDGPRFGITYDWEPSSDDTTAVPPSDASVTAVNSRQSTEDPVIPPLNLEDIAVRKIATKPKPKPNTPRPTRAEIAARKAARAPKAPTTSTSGDKTADLPIEVYQFDVASFDVHNATPWTFHGIIDLPSPDPQRPKPSDLIEATITALGGEQVLGNTTDDTNTTAADTSAKSDAKQGFTGNVVVYGAYAEPGRKIQQSWQMCTIDILSQHLRMRAERAERGDEGVYAVDVKVLLWRKGEAVKARMARKVNLPERGAWVEELEDWEGSDGEEGGGGDEE